MSLRDIGLLSISEIFGDFALKRYADNGGLSNLGYGILGYIGVVMFLVQSLRGNSIIVVKHLGMVYRHSLNILWHI